MDLSFMTLWAEMVAATTEMIEIKPAMETPIKGIIKTRQKTKPLPMANPLLLRIKRTL